MNERSARMATWLEAFETARPAAATWGDDDRAWADRVALEAARPEAAGAEFIAERAGHAMQRLAAREPIVAQTLGATVWRSGWVAAVVAVAFVCGLLADAIGSGQRINLLAPPLWGVLVWNAVVYVLLLAWPLARRARRRGPPSRPGPIVRAMEALLRVRRRLPPASSGGPAVAARRFAALWSERSRPLAALRTEALLHAGAAALALGLVAGLYARGLVLDYRAVWESTFLDAGGGARRARRHCFAPASPLSGVALPDADRVCGDADGARPGGDRRAGGAVDPPLRADAGPVRDRAAPAPRAPAAPCWRGGARGASTFRCGRPYFQRLLRHCSAAPRPRSSCSRMGTRCRRRRRSACARCSPNFGPRVDLHFAPAVPFGAEDDAAVDPPSTAARRPRACSISRRRPSPSTMAASCAASAQRCRRGHRSPCCSTPTAFARRFGGIGGRLAQRADAWRLWPSRWRRRRWSSTSKAPTGRGRAAAARRVRAAGARRALGRGTNGGAAMSEQSRQQIALSLVSHTNAGKTTLARTLLGRDVGEVRDAPHVTEFADVHTLLETADGEACTCGTRPASATAVRLAKRLRQGEQPVGRFLSEIWDRWRDRPFWASQQALRNVRDEADVVLYLVNASEAPERRRLRRARDGAAGLGRQAGDRAAQPARRAARGAAVEAAEVQRWRDAPAAPAGGARGAAARCLRALLGPGADAARRRSRRRSATAGSAR